MKINKNCVISLMMLFSLCACAHSIDNLEEYVNNKQASEEQFNYIGNYVAPELIIDGIDDDIQWSDSSEELIFGETKSAKMKIYRGESALFCFFNVEDKDLETVGDNNGDDVTKGDSVEVYFDFKNDGSNKPTTDDIQINIGAHGKTRIFVGSNGFWGSWNGLLDYSVVLNGTLNDNKDEDIGYTVELMIPYSQIGITKESIFGISCGHVQRGKESVNDVLPYTWGGLFWENTFVNPQIPKKYLLSYKNGFFLKGKEPIGKINIKGKIVDINNNPLSGALISIGDKEVLTSADGSYYLTDVESELISTFEVSKNEYQTYTKQLTQFLLKTENGDVKLDCCLLKENENRQITISGVVKNLADGTIENAIISNGVNTTLSNEDGIFSLKTPLSYDMKLILEKNGYKESITEIDLLNIVGSGTYDLGLVDLYSLSSITYFGGDKGTQLVEVETYRGLTGVNFMFKTNKPIIDGSKIEMFIDTKHSFYGRDYTDYCINLESNGFILIDNYGSGVNNNVFTSGIKNNNYRIENVYYMNVLIPYSFLGIETNEVIGVSFGIYDSSVEEWNGWGFEYNGIDTYVPPEYTDQYIRIDLDNTLYRASANAIATN